MGSLAAVYSAAGQININQIALIFSWNLSGIVPESLH